MSEANSDNLVLGKDVPWKSIDDRLLRVLSFTPMATASDNEVRSPSASMPYAILRVECLELGQEFTVLITHRIDFLHLWKAFKQRGISDEEEVLIGDLRPNAEDFQK